MPYLTPLCYAQMVMPVIFLFILHPALSVLFYFKHVEPVEDHHRFD